MVNMRQHQELMSLSTSMVACLDFARPAQSTCRKVAWHKASHDFCLNEQVTSLAFAQHYRLTVDVLSQQT